MAEKKGKRRRRRGGVWKRGNQWWGSWAGPKGGRIRESLLADNYNDALKERNRNADQAEQIRKTGRPVPAEGPLRDYLDAFLEWQRPPRQTEESWMRTKGILALEEMKSLLDMPVQTIRREHIDTYATKQAAKKAAGTVYKELGVIKKLFNWLVDVREVLAKSPAAKYEPPCDKPKKRKRFLSKEEVDAALKGCPEWLRGIVTVAVYTGMRRSEVLRLRWRMIDLKGKLITLPKTKNGDERVVPLNREAFEVLGEQHSKDVRPNDLVFSPSKSGEGGSGDNVSKALKAVLNRLGIEDATLHDLRRTAGSHMRMKGADPLTIGEVLGHRDYRSMMIYQRADLTHRRKAVALLDDAYVPAKQEQEADD